jgi:hypothetical protein
MGQNFTHDERQKALDGVSNNGRYLQHVCKKLKNDKEIVLTAVTSYAGSLKFASKELKKDHEIVLQAVKKKGSSLAFADYSLKSDPEFMLKSINLSYYSLNFASKNLKNDKEFILKAIKQSTGKILQYSGEKMKQDKEVVIEAVKSHSCSLKFASEELKNDIDVVMALLSTKKDFDLDDPFKFVGKKFKGDREIALKAVKRNGKSIQSVSEDLMKDREIILNALKNEYIVFKFLIQIDSDYMNDKEIVLAAVQSNRRMLQYASEEMKNDMDVGLKVGSLEYIGNKLKNNKEFLFKAAEMKYFDELEHEFMSERDFVLKIVQLNGKLLKSASKALRDDKEIVLESLKNSNSIRFASGRLRNDEEIALECIKNFPESFGHLGEKLKTKEFVIKALRLNPLIIPSKKKMEDMEIILMASKWHKLIKEVKTFNLNFKFE